MASRTGPLGRTWFDAAGASTGGVSDGDKGDVVVSSSGAVWTIDSNTVGVAKMAASATDVIFGRFTAGAGAGEEIACTSAARSILDDASVAAICTTLGLGTANTPQFTGVEVGHASDTTLARLSAGDLSVEGNRVFRAGGTDVPIADGGTGASTATAAFNALSPVTTRGDIIVRGATNNDRLALGTAAQKLQSDGTDVVWADEIVQKSVTILNPSAAEQVDIFVARAGYTVTRIDAYVRGSSSPSVTFKVWKGTDPTSGTAVITSPSATTSTTSVTTVTSFDSATIASGAAVWLTTTAMSGTVTALHVTVHMVRTSVS